MYDGQECPSYANQKRPMPALISPSALEPFSLPRAYALAMAAEAAYRPAAKVHSLVTHDWGFDHFDFFDICDTQAFLAADRDTLIVSFRGTEGSEMADWLTDADMTLVDGPLDARVHEGFYAALADVWQVLQHEVQRLDPHLKMTLWITGHSLGGALASLAAARWIERGRPVHGVYTFGQPRVGDAKFARNFNFEMKSTAFRFVNNNDLVSRVPPRALGYSHVGLCKYFTDGGSFEEDYSWWQTFLDRWTFRWEDFFDGEWEAAADHSMTNYRRLVAAAGAGQALVTDDTPPAPLPAIFRPPPAAQLRLIQPRRRAA